MYVTIGYHMNAAHVQGMLALLSQKLSPGGMAAWMHAGVVPYIQARVANRFQKEGDDVTGRWHPLKVETEILRMRQGFPAAHPINVRTGEMRNFLVKSPGNVTSAAGYSQVEYPGSIPAGGELAAKISRAQMGSAGPPTVARPVLGLNMTDNINLTALLSGYLL